MAQASSYRKGAVQGFLHAPDGANGTGLVLAHGAGANAEAALLVRVATTFADAGFTVLRINLPFRQKRPHGPPSVGSAAQDQSGLREAAEQMRAMAGGAVVIGGHSYGGRQASMLAAEDPTVANALLLLSYPLHPPKKAVLRTQHFPALRTSALFVHGDRDPFGTPDELRAALSMVPAMTVLSIVDRAGHDLKAGAFDLQSRAIEPLRELLSR